MSATAITKRSPTLTDSAFSLKTPVSDLTSDHEKPEISTMPEEVAKGADANSADNLDKERIQKLISDEAREFTKRMSWLVESCEGVEPSSSEDEWCQEEDEELWAKYFQEIKESKGFDINHYPGPCKNAYIWPYNKEDPDILEFAQVAIEKFNKKNGRNYEVIKIEKVNHSADYALWYYINFSVRDRRGGAIDIFQTKVEVNPMKSKDIFHIIRPKYGISIPPTTSPSEVSNNYAVEEIDISSLFLD